MADFDDDLAESRTNLPKPSARRRRAENDDEDDFFLSNDKGSKERQNKGKNENRSNQRKPSQAFSGWGEESTQKPSIKNSRRSSKGANDLTFNNENEKSDNENETEIPVIPDLDDNNDTEDFAFQVADAPDVQVHQISSYKELDNEFFKEKAFQFIEGNIDVSLLHCGLNPEDQIVEDDKVWEWSKLFTEVVSILSNNEELNKQNEAKRESVQ